MKSKLILLLVAVSIGLTGCAKEKKSSNQSAATPYPPITGPGAPAIDGDGAVAPENGDVVAWEPYTSELDRFKATGPTNSPRDFKLWVNLLNTGQGVGGNIQVQWKDSGQYTIRYFQSVNKTGTIPCCGGEYNQYNGMYPESFNKWVPFKRNGQPDVQVFHGMFEDAMGAIAIIIDNGLDLGDGAGMSELSGTIWYKNFSVVRAPGSTYMPCWFTVKGPYQCQTTMAWDLLNRQEIYTLDANNGYVRLGTFSGLTKADAFNED